MSETTEPLIRDLLAWIGPHPRPYAEVMEAWRTSCPRLPVWEEAVDRGLLELRSGTVLEVAVTARGHALLEQTR
jgi:hypothetical protein